MRKATLWLILLFITFAQSYGQIFTENTCDNLGTTTYVPMHSVATANATNRSASLIPSSNLTGIAGQTLTSIYFERTTATGEMAGTPNFKVYLKTTTDSDFGSGSLDWSTAITGAVLVYDGNPANSVGSSAGWKSFAFSNNFVYNGTDNLIVLTEYSNPSASSSISWKYAYTNPCIETSNNNTYKYTNNTTGVLPTSLSSSNYRRPYVGFDFLVSCNAPIETTVDSFTTTTASVSWTPPSILPQVGYEYFISSLSDAPAPTATPTGSVAVGTNTVAISDLLPGTTYYVWVRSVCNTDGSDNSVWTSSVTFTSECLPVDEFVETFDTSATGAPNMPNCWDRIVQLNTGVYVTTGGAAPMSPANRLYMTANTTTNTEGLALMPTVSNLQANTHRLKFLAYATSADRQLQVGYLTNTTDPTSFVAISSFTLPSTNLASTQEFTVVPTNIPVGVNRLVFRNGDVATGTATLYIDDVKWEINSSCVEPSNLALSSLTNTTAGLAWTSGGSETEWEIEYGLTGFNFGDGTLITDVATNPYSLTNLTPNTSYQYYVRAICTGDVPSSWSGPFTFTTLCDGVDEYFENFDSFTTGTNSLPDCWTKAGSSTTVNITTGGTFPGSAPNRLYMFASGSANPPTEAFAIIRPFSNLQTGNNRLRFKAYATAVDRVLEVGYVTNATDMSTFTLIESINLPSTAASSALEFTVIPGVLPAGATNLVFRNGAVPSGTTAAYIDDVRWEFNSPCTDPSNAGVTNVADTFADLTWSAGGSETQWDIEYGPTGFTQGTGTLVENTTSNPYLVTGLTESTEYQYYVRAKCTDFNSSWVGPITFSTQCAAVTEYDDNFDSYTTGTSSLPDCWTKAGSSTSVNVTTGGALPGTPPNRLYMFASGSANPPTEAFAIIRPFSNLEAGTHRLRFKAYATAADRVLEVGYVSSPSDMSTFTLIEAVNLPSTNAASAIEFTVVPGTLPAGIRNLVFRNGAVPSGTAAIYIDDVKWEFNSPCSDPIDIGVENLTDSSVSFIWTSTGTETQWDIEYGLTGFEQGTGTIVEDVTTNPYPVTGLTSNSTYQYYVRAQCTNFNSSWAGPFTFTTQCESVADYVDNFDTYPTGTSSLPTCWTKAGSSTSVYVTTGGALPGSAPNRLYMFASGTANPPTEAFAIIRPFSNLQANTHRLRFKAYASLADRELEVGYVSNPTDMSTYVFLQSIALPGTTAATAQEFTVIPGALPAGVTNLVFRNGGFPGSSATIYIDDVKWEFNSSCVEPSEVGLSALTSTTANASWTAEAGQSEFEIQYGLTGFNLGSGTLVENITTTGQLIPGLTANTSYQYYVRSICADDVPSSWAGPFTFSTLCEDVTEFVENFDTYPSGNPNLPDCWSRGGSATTTYITTGSVAPASPSNRLYMFASGSASPPTETFAILPPVSNLSAATHRLRFKYYATVADRTLEVGYLTNPSDVSSFVLIQAIQNTSTTAATTQEYIVFPSDVPAGVKNLAFRNGGHPGATATMYIDDVHWELAPTIAPVCALNATTTLDPNCDSNPATFSWDSVADVAGYFIRVGTTPGGSDVLDNFIVSSAATSYSFDPSPSTTYYWSVIPFNNVGAATGCSEQTFTTSATICYCNPIYTIGKTSNDLISNVVIPGTTLSNNSGTANVNPAYTYFTGQPNYTATLTAGQTYNMEVTVGSFGSQNIAVWVDINQDGTFTIDERVAFTETSIASGGTATLSVAIPCDFVPGLYRMRVRDVFSTAGNLIDPCASYSYGETEDYDVTVIAPVLNAPTGAATQVFCAGATIENIAVTGTQVQWYDAATEGQLLVNTTVIPTGTQTYYASQTLPCGESTDRLAVEITINETVAPTAEAQTFCNEATVADLTATGDMIQWYATADATTALASTDALATGSYFVSQTIDGCESAKVEVIVTLNTTATPTAEAQTFCNEATVADLTATGDMIQWYATADATTALASTDALATGSYFASQTIDGCESAKVEVIVTLNTTATPTAEAQTFCNGATVADLTASGDMIQWYATADATTALASTDALATGSYFASQTIDGCESTKIEVTVTVNTVSDPTGQALQEIPEDGTFASIEITGENIVWYASEADALNQENPIDMTTMIVEGVYFATQTIDGCTSAPFQVTVIVTLSNADFNMAQLRVYPNPMLDQVTVSYSEPLVKLTLMNVLGQKVAEMNVQSNEATLNTAHLPAGNYLLQIQSNEATTVVKVTKR